MNVSHEKRVETVTPPFGESTYFADVHPGYTGFPSGFPDVGRGDPFVRLKPVCV